VRTARGVGLACAFAAAACAPARERVASSSEAIIGGATDSVDTAVVAIVRQSTGALCSGTLVGPTTVLTAAHCIVGVDASDFRVLVGDTTSAPDATFLVSSTTPYPTYDSEADGIPGGVDLGFVELATAPSIAPLEVRTAPTDFSGATVTVVGFGADDGTDDSGFGTRRSVALDVTDVCSRIFQAGGEDANACVGDSGGAVLVGGDVVGIVSGGHEGCSSPTTFTRVDAHATWIQAVLAGNGTTTCAACIGPDPSCTAATETTSASVDAGATGGDDVPARGGGCVAAPSAERGRGAAWLVAPLALGVRRRRRRAR
jgi:V8-like Glu-specific endopeptidase